MIFSIQNYLWHYIPTRYNRAKNCHRSKIVHIYMVETHQDVQRTSQMSLKRLHSRTSHAVIFYRNCTVNFCVWSQIDTRQTISNKITYKVSQKNQNFPSKIGFNSGCNIKNTWLLKVEYLLT